MKTPRRVLFICDDTSISTLIERYFKDYPDVEIVTANPMDAARKVLFERGLSKALICGSMTTTPNIDSLKFIADTLIAGNVECAGYSSDGRLCTEFEKVGIRKFIHYSWDKVRGWITAPRRIELPL